ncbi:MAG: ParB N-terminal domain-containing protein [Candidatus Nanoarchaeia archaeon]
MGRQVLLPAEFIIEVLGLSNYRRPTKTGLDQLANSLEIGLLEPLIISFNTKTNTWKFLDGRRRFSAAYMKGYEHIATEIYYDLDAEMEERLEVSLNASKSKIPSADIAVYAKTLAEQINKYKKSKNQNSITLNEMAAIMCRSTDTISNAFAFNELDPSIMRYVLDHPEEKLYFKSIRIGKKLKEQVHQKKFFEIVLEEIIKIKESKQKKKEETEKSKSKKGVEEEKYYSENKFKKQLTKYVNSINETGIMFMKMQTAVPNKMPKTIKSFLTQTDIFSQYINSLKHLLTVSSELKQNLFFKENQYLGSMKLPDDEINALVEAFDTKAGSTSFSKAITKYITNVRQESLHDEMLKYLMTVRGGSQKGELRAIGDKIEYVLTNLIDENSGNIRKVYSDEAINRLAEEFRRTFQVKPGLLVPEKDAEGNVKKYIIAYGKSRFLAVEKAEIGFFKCYIREDLLPHEIALLQALEDLSESDKYMERAKKIAAHFELISQIKAQQGIDYTKEDFIKEHDTLGSKKMLHTALYVLTLPKDIQLFMEQSLLNVKCGIKLGKLPEDERFEIFYSMTIGNKSASEIKNLIDQKVDAYVAAQNGVMQHKLFEVEPVYSVAINEFYSNIQAIKAQFISAVDFIERNNKTQFSRQVYYKMARVMKDLNTLSAEVYAPEKIRKDVSDLSPKVYDAGLKNTM